VTAVDRPDNGQDEGWELRCPYCGSEIEPELTYTTMAYSEHRDLTAYECESWECGARWDNRGRVERPSKVASARAGAGEQRRQQLAAVLRKHTVDAFAGCDTACSCDRKWRTNIAYREHLTDELLALLTQHTDEETR